MNPGTRSKQGRRGNALVPALMAVLLTSALCVCYMGLSLSKSRESQVSVDSKRAFYVAEAGLAEAYYGLARGETGAVASEGRPARFGAGVYWVACEDLGDRVVLHSTGLSGLGRAAVSATLRKSQSSVASLGLHANQRIDLSSGVLVDAYDSSAGPYQPPGGLPLGLGGPPPGAIVGSNANIYLSGKSGLLAGARVIGDAIPGPGGSVVRGTGASVSGSTAPATDPTVLPALSVNVPADALPLTPRPGTPVLLSSGSYAWTTLHLLPSTLLHITGPADVVLDQLVLDGGSRLEIDAGPGAVRISVASYVKLAAGSNFTTLSQSPDRVSLFSSASQTIDRDGDGIADPPLTIAANGPFYGSIYAPGALLTLPKSFTVYGSAVADQILLGPGAQLHFDRALLGSLADNSLPQFICWRVEELPDSQLVRMGFDPLTVLRVNSIVPVKPALAHYAVGTSPLTLVAALVAPAKL